jgi:hypothetical protein
MVQNGHPLYQLYRINNWFNLDAMPMSKLAKLTLPYPFPYGEVLIPGLNRARV